MNAGSKEVIAGFSRIISRIGYDILFLCVLAIAFIMRLPYIFTESMGSDEALYAWCAQKVFLNPCVLFSREIIEHHPPLFPLILSVGNFFSSPVVAYHAIVMFMSLSGIVLIYFLGIKFSSKFLGFFCALLLTFNYSYLLNGAALFIDVTVTVFYIILLFILADVNAKSSLRRDVGIGIIASIIFLLKWSGVAVIPFIVAYYLFLPGERIILNRIKRMFVPVFLTGSVFIVFSIVKLIRVGSTLPDINELVTGGFYPTPPWFYFANLHNMIMIPVLLPLFLWGVYSIFKTGYRYRMALITCFAVSLVVISIPAIRNLRYSIIVLPAMFLITGLGLENLLKRLCKTPQKLQVARVIALCITFLLCWSHYPRIERLLKRSLSTSTGLSEAGYWLKEHARPDTIVISQNMRPTRYYSGINFQRFGGNLIVLPSRKEDFEQLISSHKGHILLQVDFWSESNPSDFRPFSRSREEERYFNDLGFYLVKEARRALYARHGDNYDIAPVVKIFERTHGK